MTTIQVRDLIIKNINKEINHNSDFVRYNRKSIMKQAHKIFKEGIYSFSDSLKQAWESAKRVVIKCRIALTNAKTRLMDLYTPEQNDKKLNAFVNLLVNLK